MRKPAATAAFLLILPLLAACGGSSTNPPMAAPRFGGGAVEHVDFMRTTNPITLGVKFEGETDTRSFDFGTNAVAASAAAMMASAKDAEHNVDNKVELAFSRESTAGAYPAIPAITSVKLGAYNRGSRTITIAYGTNFGTTAAIVMLNTDYGERFAAALAAASRSPDKATLKADQGDAVVKLIFDLSP